MFRVPITLTTLLNMLLSGYYRVYDQDNEFIRLPIGNTDQHLGNSLVYGATTMTQ